MPLYEYQCEACGERFEVIQKFSDTPIESCRKCGEGPVRKLQSSPAFQFKGSGWYITDYAKKSSSDAGSSKGESKGKGEGTTDGKTDGTSESKGGSTGESKTETKTDTKSESKSDTKAATKPA